ncbi:MAG: hypothetical protein Q7J32_17955 [Sphingomonadaceae bacterium]|nr:hypothetical protein [Sphingomonadaceae bacterium]
MRNTLLLAGLLIALPAAVAAEPPSAWQVGNDGFVIHYRPADLRDASYRGQLLQTLERSATRLCAGLAPRRVAVRCAADRVAAATARLPRYVQQAVVLAQRERDALQLAAR